MFSPGLVSVSFLFQHFETHNYMYLLLCHGTCNFFFVNVKVHTNPVKCLKFQPTGPAKFCDECGAPYLRETSKFCSECGIKRSGI